MAAAGRPDTTIALLALPESMPAALYGLYEVFLSVGRTWEELTGERTDSPRLAPQIVTRDGLPVMSPCGLPITAQDSLGEADVVIVTDLVVDANGDFAEHWREEISWLHERHAAGAIIASVCTGTIFLAEAGLLDGCEATTHWSAVDLIGSRYPAVRLTPQRILTSAGQGDQIVTSGGATAWEDLALYLIARLCGGAEAVRIARIFLLGDHSDGQLPYAGARRSRRHEDAVIADVQSWVGENYHRQNPVGLMIARSGLSERTFVRRFRAATGYAPMDYVQTLRIEEAKHLLEATDAAVDVVAVEVGYEDPNFFRRLFKRRVGITPARYRQKFATLRRSAARPALARAG